MSVVRPGQTSSSMYGMSGSEKRLCPAEVPILSCWSGGDGVTMEMEEEEEEAEGGHEEKFLNLSHSELSMTSERVLSLRRAAFPLLVTAF